MGPPDSSGPDELAAHDRSRLVLDDRILGSVHSLRPVAWVVLEAVVLGAAADGDDLVARTSARHVAELLGLDAQTASAALRVLRTRGLLELRRPASQAGRFGLSSYVLGDVLGLGLRLWAPTPYPLASHLEDRQPTRDRRQPDTSTVVSPELRSGAARSSSGRSGAQGSLDLRLEGDG